MKKVSLDNILLVASFLAIAYSPYYCFVFIALVVKSLAIAIGEHKANKSLEEQFRSELLKVQLVSAQVEELQSSINNVRAAVSLGSNRR